VLGAPPLGCILAGKDLEVVDITDLFRGVDVDPDSRRISLPAQWRDAAGF
jgi:hypothetical protein